MTSVIDVVVGSRAGRVPTPWLAAYTAARHGVRALSAELAAIGSPRTERTVGTAAVRRYG